MQPVPLPPGVPQLPLPQPLKLDLALLAQFMPTMSADEFMNKILRDEKAKKDAEQSDGKALPGNVTYTPPLNARRFLAENHVPAMNPPNLHVGNRAGACWAMKRRRHISENSEEWSNKRHKLERPPPPLVSRSLGKYAVEILKQWMFAPEHVDNPYPTEQEKVNLAAAAGITKKQVSNWFVNARKRLWAPSRGSSTVPSAVPSAVPPTVPKKDDVSPPSVSTNELDAACSLLGFNKN